ncbi:hypothetical protein ACFL24_00090 [Patescibacteria group bacterium]
MKKIYQISIKVFAFLLIVGLASFLIYKAPIQSFKKGLASVGLEQSIYKCNLK